MIDPTDRSMPPAMITSVIPTEMTPMFETWRKTSDRLSGLRKILPPSASCGDASTPMTSSTISPR
jgi:hypothetical protein